MLVVFALDTPAGPASVKTQVRSHNADLGGDPKMVQIDRHRIQAYKQLQGC
jgi:hypothetical protein